MNPTNTRLTHELSDVLRRLDDPARFIAVEEAQYDAQILNTAASIADAASGCRLVWLCGPSSVGKTTTAARLCAALEARGVAAFVVSLDDFYRGIGQAERLCDGRFDYESPKALDLPQLHRCLTELMTTGETSLPQYDFEAGAPALTRRFLRVQGNAAVIFEGIQAFSPLLTEGLDPAILGKPIRVFVNARTRFTDGDRVLLCRRDIRLCRRLLRDERTRGSDFADTLSMWQGVLAGDETHIFPFADAADHLIDTALGYEPCVIAPLLRDRLHTLRGTPYEATAVRLKAALDCFEPLTCDHVPHDSILREFIGKCH